MENNEIVLFETADRAIKLNVPVERDNVWLTQEQMTELFDTTKQNISLHVNNCFKEGEVDRDSVDGGAFFAHMLLIFLKTTLFSYFFAKQSDSLVWAETDAAVAHSASITCDSQ